MPTNVVSQYKQLIKDIVQEQVPIYMEKFLQKNPLLTSDNVTTAINNNILTIINTTDHINLFYTPEVFISDTDEDIITIHVSVSSMLEEVSVTRCTIEYSSTGYDKLLLNQNCTIAIPASVEEISLTFTDSIHNTSSVYTYMVDDIPVVTTPIVHDTPILSTIHELAYTKIDEYVTRSIEYGFKYDATINDELVTVHIDYTPFHQNNITDNLMLAIINCSLLNKQQPINVVGYQYKTNTYRGILTVIPCDMEQLLKLFAVAMTHKQTCMIEGQLLKSKISTASDDEIRDIIHNL